MNVEETNGRILQVPPAVSHMDIWRVGGGRGSVGVSRKPRSHVDLTGDIAVNVFLRPT